MISSQVNQFFIDNNIASTEIARRIRAKVEKSVQTCVPCPLNGISFVAHPSIAIIVIDQNRSDEPMETILTNCLLLKNVRIASRFVLTTQPSPITNSTKMDLSFIN